MYYKIYSKINLFAVQFLYQARSFHLQASYRADQFPQALLQTPATAQAEMISVPSHFEGFPTRIPVPFSLPFSDSQSPDSVIQHTLHC